MLYVHSASFHLVHFIIESIKESETSNNYYYIRAMTAYNFASGNMASLMTGLGISSMYDCLIIMSMAIY
jgi:hypothetical protein